jgi:hypothetical protein
MTPQAFRVFRLSESVDDRYPEIDRTKSEELGENEYVTRKNKYFKDFDCIDIDGLCVSERARRIFEALGLPEVQFNENIRINGQLFHRISTRRTVNCLDRSASVLRFFPNAPDRVMQVVRYRFHHELLHDPDIFTIPEEQGWNPERTAAIYITSGVEAALRNAGLIGFRVEEMEGFDDPNRVEGPPYRYENATLGFAVEIPSDWEVYASPGNQRKKLRPGKMHRATNIVIPPLGDGWANLLSAQYSSSDPYRCMAISLGARRFSNDEDVGDSLHTGGAETLESHRASRCPWNVNGFEITYVDEFPAPPYGGRLVHRAAWAEIDPNFLLHATLTGYRPESFDVVLKVFQTLRRIEPERGHPAARATETTQTPAAADTLPEARSTASWMNSSVGQTARVTETDIASLEKNLNLALPEYYRQFLMNFPTQLVETRHEFSDGGSEPISNREFYNRVDQILYFNKDVRAPGTPWNEYGGPWPKQYLVIGDDGCGNYWTLNLGAKREAVYFYDHETGRFERQFKSVREFADSLVQKTIERNNARGST